MLRISTISNNPIVSIDTIGVSTLYVTDGIGINVPVNISSFNTGTYDLFYDGVSVTTAVYSPTRSLVNYLGTFNCSVAGQITCNVTPVYNAKWEIYNAYNQRLNALVVITEEVGVNYLPTNSSTSMEPFNNNPLNCGTITTGLSETVKIEYLNRGFLNSSAGAYGILNGIGWNSNSFVNGVWGGGTHDDSNFAAGILCHARCVEKAVGVNKATMLIGAAVHSSGSSSVIYSGTVAGPNYTTDNQGHLTMEWMG